MKDRMVVALRVLTCINNRSDPAQADITILQSLVHARDRNVDHDELACIVIGAELQRRKDARLMHGEVSRANA